MFSSFRRFSDRSSFPAGVPIRPSANPKQDRRASSRRDRRVVPAAAETERRGSDGGRARGGLAQKQASMTSSFSGSQAGLRADRSSRRGPGGFGVRFRHLFQHGARGQYITVAQSLHETGGRHRTGSNPPASDARSAQRQGVRSRRPGPLWRGGRKGLPIGGEIGLDPFGRGTSATWRVATASFPDGRGVVERHGARAPNQGRDKTARVLSCLRYGLLHPSGVAGFVRALAMRSGPIRPGAISHAPLHQPPPHTPGPG